MRRKFLLMLVLVAVFVLLALPLAMASAQATGQTFHVVARGENLFRIALRYNTTVQAISTANNIYNPNLIFAGQVLLIPTGAVHPPPVTPPPTIPPVVTPPPGGTFYVVRHGDTLASIAAMFGTTWQAIAQANGIMNPNLIFAGQTLFIPPRMPQQVVTYFVQPGDTLQIIARRFNTTWQAIASFNGIANPNLIFVGQRLLIPI
jgi:LysM repeat protein